MLLLSLLISGNLLPNEPKQVSQCSVTKTVTVKSNGADPVESILEIENLDVKYHLSSKSIRYTLFSGPVLDPIFDTARSHLFWITSDEVCSLNLKTGKAKQVYYERGMSGIGRIKYVGGSIHIQGANPITCLRSTYSKNKYVFKNYISNDSVQSSVVKQSDAPQTGI